MLLQTKYVFDSEVFCGAGWTFALAKCFLEISLDECVSGGSLLLADDDVVIQRLVQPHLERAGFRTILADNGARAWELIMTEAPEIIILDIQMPEMDGLGLLRLLKSIASTKAVPVIIISASYERPLEEEAKAWGAVGFLTKPFSPAQLLAMIRRVPAKS